MEKELQDEILTKYSPIINATIDRYIKRGFFCQSYKKDFFQEAWIRIQRYIAKNQKIPNIHLVTKKAVRNYMNVFMGVGLKEKGKRSTDTHFSNISHRLESSSTDDDYGKENQDKDLNFPVSEQPSLEEKDLHDKIHDLALKILSGKEYTAVYSDDKDLSPDELHRRRSMRHKATVKLRNYVKENWK